MTARDLQGGAIVIAAGEGRRFGSDKRFARLPTGDTLLRTSVRTTARAFEEVVLVLGDTDTRKAETEAGAHVSRIVHCPTAGQGMGASIACGLRASNDWEWWFIVLADMPWIRIDTLKCLQSTLLTGIREGITDCTVRPVYKGRQGNPVGFGPDWRQALGALQGDHGARTILQSSQHRVDVVVDDPGVVRDVDQPSDLV